MDIDDNQPERIRPRSLLLEGARWPQDSPLSPTDVRLAQQHTVLSINRFLAIEGLPEAYRPLFPGLIIPLAAWLLRRQRNRGKPLLVGISGAQGSGKSTFALALQLVLRDSFAARSCILSLDDAYLSREERRELAAQIHPLLATRGVPGTHNVPLLARTLGQLLNEGAGTVPIPSFDKARDEQIPEAQWPKVAPAPEVVFLEGWCVGARAQTDAELTRPVNDLEGEEDSDGIWRRYVNQQLKTMYEPLFDLLAPQIFLKAPNWQAVHSWRTEQECKLIKRRGTEYQGGLETEAKLQRFIDHYQRLTEAMLQELPARADITLTLNSEHQFSHLVRK